MKMSVKKVEKSCAYKATPGIADTTSITKVVKILNATVIDVSIKSILMIKIKLI